MKNHIIRVYLVSQLLFSSVSAFAHCDTKDGPVILAAQNALKTGNVNLVLIWVQPKDEEAIKVAFQKALQLRKLSPVVQKVIDTYFFETLVRIHRAGEGAPYSGLKDSAEVEIPIAESDKAIESGSPDDVLKLLNGMIEKEVREKFKDAISKKNYVPDNVTAGREFVESYVGFLHYVEGIYNAITSVESEHTKNEEVITPVIPKTSSSKECNYPTNETSGHATNYLIIGGTLLIILIQVILYFRKT